MLLLNPLHSLSPPSFFLLLRDLGATPTFVCEKHTDEKTMPPLQSPPSQPRWAADQTTDAEKPAKAMS
jgi:hypothetical protein